MPEIMSNYCHSTIPSGCSSLESLDLPIHPEPPIRLSQVDGTLTVHAHHNDDTSKHVNDADEQLMKVDKNKTLPNWDGYRGSGGKMSKTTNLTSPPKYYYNATPSTLATMPIWVKHYKK